MNEAWQALIGTPWWVYLLFFYLMKIGIEAMKPHTVPLWKLALLPGVFFCLSLHSLFTAFANHPLSAAFYTAALAIGIMLGRVLGSRQKVLFDKEQGLIQLEGSSLTLLIILGIFCTKYYFGYQLSVDPELAEDTHFERAILSSSGLFVGLLVGRLAYFLNLRQRTPHVDLSST